MKSCIALTVTMVVHYFSQKLCWSLINSYKIIIKKFLHISVQEWLFIKNGLVQKFRKFRSFFIWEWKSKIKFQNPKTNSSSGSQSTKIQIKSINKWFYHLKWGSKSKETSFLQCKSFECSNKHQTQIKNPLGVICLLHMQFENAIYISKICICEVYICNIYTWNTIHHACLEAPFSH